MIAAPPSPGSRKWLLALVAATLVLRGGALLLPGALAADPDSYQHLAENLLTRGVLGHGDAPTAYRPPLYPLLLVPCVASGPAARAAIGLLHVGLGLATVLLVYRLGRQIGLDRFAPLAALLVAADPILLAQSRQVMSETPAALLAVVGLAAVLAAVRRPTAARAAIAGGLLGLGSLCRPELLVWTALAAVILPLQAAPKRKRLPLFAACASAALVVLAPWAARNWRQLGRPVLTTTHGGYTLLLANNPSFYDYLRTAPWGSVWDPAAFHRQWAQTRAAAAPGGELAIDRAAYAEAWRAITAEPGMFLYASVVRAGRLWQPAPRQVAAVPLPGGTAGRWAVGAFYLLEFLLAAVGLVAVGRRWFDRPRLRTALCWGGLLVASFTAIHAIYWTNMRMRATLMPLVALAAAAGLAWLAERCGPRRAA